MTRAKPSARRLLGAADDAPATNHECFEVPCIYCREPIQADSFTFWSSTKRLMSATCPTCGRRTTLTTATWLRWRSAPAHAIR